MSISTISNSNKGSNNSMTISNNTQQQGNTTMKNQIFSLHSEIVKTLTYKLNDRDLAYDIGTDAIVKAIELSEQFDSNKANLKTWVSSIAWRLFLDNRKSYQNKNVSCGYDAQVFDIMAGSYESEQSDSTDVSEDDFWGLVSDIVNEKEYGCLVRRFRDEMSYADIAENMGIPKGSVMSNLNGGKAKLSNNPTFARLFNTK